MTHNSEVAGLRRKVEALERRLPGSPIKQRAIKGRGAGKGPTEADLKSKAKAPDDKGGNPTSMGKGKCGKGKKQFRKFDEMLNAGGGRCFYKKDQQNAGIYFAFLAAADGTESPGRVTGGVENLTTFTHFDDSAGGGPLCFSGDAQKTHW